MRRIVMLVLSWVVVISMMVSAFGLWEARVAQAAVGSNPFVDSMNDFTKMHSSSSGLELDTGNPEKYEGDASRVKIGSAGTGASIVYSTAKEIVSFKLDTYRYNGDPSTPLKFYLASDGITFRAFEPLMYRVPKSGYHTVEHWVYESINIPEGRYYLKIEFGDKANNWNPQLSEIEIRQGYLQDDFNDFSKMDFYTPGLQLATDQPEKRDEDPSRLKIGNAGAGAYIQYHTDFDIDSFYLDTHEHTNSSASVLKFFTSTNGSAYVERTIARREVPKVEYGVTMKHYLYEADSLPAGIRYVRIEFDTKPNNWNPDFNKFSINKYDKDSENRNPSANDLIRQLFDVNPNNRHPRIMATQADFNWIKANKSTDSNLSGWYANLTSSANALLSAPVSTYTVTEGRLLDVSRTVLRRVIDLSMMYQISGDTDYASRAWEELAAAANFPDWHVGHFLDTAEMTAAFAIGYDWLYHDLNGTQRWELRQAIVEKAFIPARDAYQGQWSSLRGSNNQSSVINSGMALGALAIGDEIGYERISGEILQEAVKYIQRPIAEYAPDGGWEEGPNYWHYGTRYLIYLLAAMETALNNDYGLSGKPGLSRMGYFPIYMHGGVYGSFNFADNGGNMSKVPENLWLARKYDNPDFAWYTRTTTGSGGGALNMLFYDPDYYPQQPSGALSKDGLFQGIHAGSFRSEFGYSNELYIGFKGGDNQASHGDLDAGSFVLDALGERWAHDLGQENYGLPGISDESANGERWNYYRKRAEGHNTMVINPGTGPDQDPLSVSPIIRMSSSDSSAFAVADLTDAYAAEVNSMQRGFRIDDDRQWVMVQDRIMPQSNSTMYWFMHTKAAVSISPDGKTATLSQNGKTLKAVMLSPSHANAKFTVMNAEPLSTSPNPAGQSSNANMRKLTIKLSNWNSETISVLFVPGSTLPSPLPQVMPLNQW